MSTTPPPDSLPKADAQLWEAAELALTAKCFGIGCLGGADCESQRACDAFDDMATDSRIKSLLERIAALRALIERTKEGQRVVSYTEEAQSHLYHILKQTLALDEQAAARWEKK